jgi:hypothetical protein
MAKFPIPENCSTYVPMILKEFCTSKINGLVMKNFFRRNLLLKQLASATPETTEQNFMKLGR